MKRVTTIVFLLIILVGCSKHETRENEYNRVVFTTYLSGVWYTQIITTCESEGFTYDHHVTYFADTEEKLVESYVVTTDFERTFIQSDGKWIYDDLQERSAILLIPEIDPKRINELDLEWFQTVQGWDSSSSEYDMVSKEEHKEDIYRLLFGVEYDDYVTEDSWGTYDLYLKLDEYNQIVGALYLSFPSYQLYFIKTNEFISLPQDIIEYYRDLP